MTRALPQPVKRASATHQAVKSPAVSRPPVQSQPVETAKRGPCPCGGGCPRCSRSTTNVYESEASAASWLNLRPSGGDGAYARVLPTPPPAAGLGAGSPLPTSLRRDWEPRLGTDLSAVRIYSGGAASALAYREQAQAFTYGNHIVLGSSVGPAYSAYGRSVLAHEVTHAVQQTAPATSAKLHATPGLQVQRIDITLDDVADTASAAWQGIQAAPGRIADAAIETAEETVEFGYSQLIALLEEYAPDFLAFLRAGPVEFIKERVLEALDSLLGGLITSIRREGLAGALRDLFGDNFSGIATIVSDLRAGNCDSLFAAIASVIDFFETALGPYINDLRQFLGEAGEFFSDTWRRFGGQSAVDFISEVAGEFWNALVSMANDFWEATAEVRGAFDELWEDFKRRFDLAWDSGVGAVDWLIGQAREAWEAIKAELGPALVPLEILAGLVLLATPLGPFVQVAAIYYATTTAFNWIRANWGDIRQFFIDSRDTLYNDVIPAIMSGVDAISGALNTAAQWMVEQIGAIASKVREIATALGLTPLLDAFSGFVSELASDIEALTEWVSQEFTTIVEDIRNALHQLHETLRPLYGLLAALILFPAAPFLLPVVLAGWAWRLTPDCIKAPVIDWVIELMRAAIEAIPAFSAFGEWWPDARTEIINTLDTAAGLPMEEKIEATNRIAKMMTLEDVEWIGNLVSAAIQAPAHFVDMIIEELTGMDLTRSLPFERTAAPTGHATPGLAPGSAAMGVLSQPVLSETDVSVDAVGRLDVEPDLLRSAGLTGDGEVEFGDRGPGFASLDAIRAELAAAPAADLAGPEATAGAPAAPSFAGMTPEEETEARLQALMDQPMNDECPSHTDANQPVAAPETIPEEMKFGPLTQAQRARYTLNQMGKGMAKWFDCNKAWLIPSIIVAVIALIGLEILTGGAVTAALPAVMEILTAIMLGVAAVRSAGYLGEYLALAAPGDVAGGARSLARSFAVIAIEAVFALLFNIGSVMKALRGGLRNALHEGVAAARAFGRTTVEAAQTLGRVAVRGARTAVGNVRRVAGAALREGRLIMEGLGEGIGRGMRSLDDLARRLWNQLRFRRFKLRRSGRHIQLWGHLNPWVLLADGTIEEVTLAGSGTRPRVGTVVEVAGQSQRGLLVGVRDTDVSSFVRYLNDLDDSARRTLFQELSTLDDAARRAAIQGIGQTAENARILRASMTGGGVRAGRGAPGGGNAAHHIVPSTHGYGSAADARDILQRCGIGVNDGLNGVFVPPNIHAHLHTHAYMDAVVDALAPLDRIADIAARRARAVSILDSLAQRILRGEFTR